MDFTYKEGDEFVGKELSIIKQLLIDSKKELEHYREYKTTSDGIQACEKLWGALAHSVRLNQYVQGYELPSGHDANILYLSKIGFSEQETRNLRKKANELHKRFYTGNFDIKELEEDYKYVNEKVNQFIRKLKMVK